MSTTDAVTARGFAQLTPRRARHTWRWRGLLTINLARLRERQKAGFSLGDKVRWLCSFTVTGGFPTFTVRWCVTDNTKLNHWKKERLSFATTKKCFGSCQGCQPKDNPALMRARSSKPEPPKKERLPFATTKVLRFMPRVPAQRQLRADAGKVIQT